MTLAVFTTGGPLRSPPSPPARCRSSAAPTPRASPTPEVLEGHGLAQDAVPRLLQLAVRPPLFERPSLRRRARRRAQLQLGVKRGHQREELRQLLVRAGPKVVDHAGQARGEDVHAVHKPQRAPSAGTSRPTCRGLGGRGGCSRPA